MIVPNQLKNTSFPLAGRGAYRAQDVDEFQKRVYAAYSELYSENSVLKKKFASLSALVEEYNEGKNSIANAIIKSQALSDKMLEDAKKQAADLLAEAKQKAQELISESKLKADEYVSEKTSTADAYLSRAETELERVKKQAESAAADYTKKVNEKAEQIIANANEQASKIVASAYADAKKASEKCDEIISEAKTELNTIKAEIAAFKKQTEKMISVIVPALDKIEIPDDIDLDSSIAVTEPEGISENKELIEPFVFNDAEPEEDSTKEEPDSVMPAEEVIEVKDEDAEPEEFEDVSSVSDKLNSYFSSFFEDIHSSSEHEEATDDDESDESDTFDGEEDATVNMPSENKGYNGNNTSFKPASGFVVTDFDDEED